SSSSRRSPMLGGWPPPWNATGGRGGPSFEKYWGSHEWGPEPGQKWAHLAARLGRHAGNDEADLVAQQSRVKQRWQLPHCQDLPEETQRLLKEAIDNVSWLDTCEASVWHPNGGLVPGTDHQGHPPHGRQPG